MTGRKSAASRPAAARKLANLRKLARENHTAWDALRRRVADCLCGAGGCCSEAVLKSALKPEFDERGRRQHATDVNLLSLGVVARWVAGLQVALALDDTLISLRDLSHFASVDAATQYLLVRGIRANGRTESML